MATDNRSCFFLIDSFIEDGFLYIVNQTNILVTVDSELKIGARVQFAYTESVKKPKIKKGKIIMESGRYFCIFQI